MSRSARFPAVLPLVLWLSLSALPLAAQFPPFVSEIQVYPPHPVAGQWVEFGVLNDCPLDRPVVTREGSVIRIILPSAGICDPPIPFEFKVAYRGVLPAGTYTVEASYQSGAEPYAMGSFEVRDSLDPAILSPTAVPAGAPSHLQVRIWTPIPEVDPPLCPANDCVVRVGGTLVDTQRDSNGNLWITAPPHAAGFAEVTITNGAVTRTLPTPLYYFDRDEAPSEAFFERILFPVLVNTPGGHGSQWRSEAVIANPGPWFIETFNNIRPIACPTTPCGERFSPGEYAKFSGTDFPHGVALLVPRNDAAAMSFGLRVRDVSRVAESFGSEIPVVRESEMSIGSTLTLLDVPVDPRYRTKVRIYGLNIRANHSVEGRLTTLRTGVEGSRNTTRFTMNTQCADYTCSISPAYAEVDLPTGEQGQRVNVYVDVDAPGSLTWAFASVTNNVTQQVTIVAPDGSGGTPCDPCRVP
jgi:hypothetical protein